MFSSSRHVVWRMLRYSNLIFCISWSISTRNVFCIVELINFLSEAVFKYVVSESQNWDPCEIVRILLNDVGWNLSNKDRETKTPNSGKRKKRWDRNPWSWLYRFDSIKSHPSFLHTASPAAETKTSLVLRDVRLCPSKESIPAAERPAHTRSGDRWSPEPRPRLADPAAEIKARKRDEHRSRRRCCKEIWGER